MHILIGLGIAVALGYFWLIGMWYARVLVCLILMAAFGAVGVVMGQNIPVTIVTFGLIGTGIGWAIGSIPTWYWREKMRNIAAAEHSIAIY